MAVNNVAEDEIYAKGVLKIFYAFLFGDSDVRERVILRWLQYETVPNASVMQNIAALLHSLLVAPVSLDISPTVINIFHSENNSLSIPLNILQISGGHCANLRKLLYAMARLFKTQKRNGATGLISYSNFRYNTFLEVEMDRGGIAAEVVRTLLRSQTNPQRYTQLRNIINAGCNDLISHYYTAGLHMEGPDAPGSLEEQTRRTHAIESLGSISQSTRPYTPPASHSQSLSSSSSHLSYSQPLSSSYDSIFSSH